MAKVIFEFTWVESGECRNGRQEVLDAKAYLADSSPVEKTGPHDLLANIVLTMAPEIIQEARDEMLVAMKAMGMEAKCDFVPRPANAVKH
ncbi:TPA: hypothetical protein L1190_003629 [Escherichia coli]|nr:hypothetical protein [Escherichia coli]